MNDYKEIINIAHFEPKNHKRMSIYNRASIFSPFAALTGYSDNIYESGRLTDNEKILTEDEKCIIDLKIQKILKYIKDRPLVKVLYFESDKTKNGGEYLEYISNIKRVDEIEHTIIFNDNFKISINNLVDIEIINEK